MKFPTALTLSLAACGASPGPLAPTIDPASAAALRDHVTFLATLDPPRTAEHPAALERAARYIEEALRAAGARVERQRFTVDGESYSNVRAFYGPQRGPRLVVGAHYDACDGTPGADDNASAVAVLLALAPGLSDAELAGPVELVAYTLEEPPYFATGDMGSAHHARLLAAEGVELSGMLCLEMLGFYSDADGSQEYPLPGLGALFGTRGDFLALVGRPEDEELLARTHAAMQGGALRVEKLAAPAELTGVDFSDHRCYWDAGYTAVMLTDTAFFRNPHYHEASDTPDTLDYARMELAVGRVRAAVDALAGRASAATAK